MGFPEYVMIVYSKYINLLYLFKTYQEFNVTVYLTPCHIITPSESQINACMEICYSFEVHILNYLN
jgi:hypothetical protein